MYEYWRYHRGSQSVNQSTDNSKKERDNETHYELQNNTHKASSRFLCRLTTFFSRLAGGSSKSNRSRRTAEEYRTNIKLKIWSESSICSTSGARHVILVTNPVICYKWGKDRNISSISSGFTSYLNISFVFTQRLTLRSIQRTSDAYDNPLTSCSIPYTDLRIIIMNYVLKRWNGQLRPEN